MPKDDETIRPFKVVYDDAAYKDLIARLTKTRFVEPLQDDFTDGFNGDYLREVVNHWRTKYDWKKQIDFLNSYEQFVTEIEGLIFQLLFLLSNLDLTEVFFLQTGINIHFVRVKPTGSPKVVKPILLQNGWPSAYYQFYKLIDLLKKPVNGVGLEIIVPSRPGFGYSDHPRRAGFGPSDSARIYNKLMKRLGHNKYFAAGS